jgi:hypothetical protein
LQIEAEVAPRRASGLAFEILGGQIAPAAPQPLAVAAGVGNHELAVVAQIRAPFQRRVQRWHEERHPYACLLQRREIRLPAQHAAHAVEQQPHSHSGTRPFGQMGVHRRTDRISPQEEGAQLEGVLRAIDYLQEGAQRLRAIGMDAEGTVACRRRLPQRRGHPGRPAAFIGEGRDRAPSRR